MLHRIATSRSAAPTLPARVPCSSAELRFDHVVELAAEQIVTAWRWLLGGIGESPRVDQRTESRPEIRGKRLPARVRKIASFLPELARNLANLITSNPSTPMHS